MTRLKGIMTTTAIAALMAVGGGLADDARASTVTVSQTFDGNDCSGFFGTGFGSCDIFVNNDTGEKIKLSPVIAKYDFYDDKAPDPFEEGDLAKTETNDLFPSIDGDEFSWSSAAVTSGTWSYTPGAGDPGVKYWAAKGGNFFNLFWTVEETTTDAGGVCETGTDLYTLACLSEALVVDSGNWSTPINPANGKNFGLSHLTFYDSVPPSIIPLPAAGWLMLGALGGLGMVARRRRRAA